MRFVRLLGAGAMSLGLFTHAHAAFVTPSEWTRPTSDAQAAADRTTFQEWNLFTTPAGPNDPDVAEFNPNAGAGPNPSKANLYDTSGGSFVTGGGNIYSPTFVLAIDADVPSYGLGGDYRTTVFLQLRTLGSEIAYDAVRLTYAGDGGASQTINAASRQELERIALGGFGGAQVDTLFRFDVPFSPSSFKLEFDAAESSVSLDRASIDTLTALVPEPGVASLLAIPTTSLLARPRRRGR